MALHSPRARARDVRLVGARPGGGVPLGRLHRCPHAAGTDDASALHDAVYQAAELIAQVAGWSVRKVLRWADEVFLERMLDDGSAPAVAYTYYAGVRLLGGLYHGLRRWFRGPAYQYRRQVRRPLPV